MRDKEREGRKCSIKEEVREAARRGEGECKVREKGSEGEGVRARE